MNEMPPHNRFPYGTRDVSDPSARCAECGRHVQETDDEGLCSRCAMPEPERLRCRSCGGLWDEPKLSPDGVCPLCQQELEER